MLHVNTSIGRFWSSPVKKSHSEQKGWFTPINIPSLVFIHCSCVLCLYDAFMPLQNKTDKRWMSILKNFKLPCARSDGNNSWKNKLTHCLYTTEEEVPLLLFSTSTFFFLATCGTVLKLQYRRWPLGKDRDKPQRDLHWLDTVAWNFFFLSSMVFRFFTTLVADFHCWVYCLREFFYCCFCSLYVVGNATMWISRQRQL